MFLLAFIFVYPKGSERRIYGDIRDISCLTWSGKGFCVVVLVLAYLAD